MYKEYSPCKILFPYVDKYWEYKGRPKHGIKICIPPYGCTDFVFILGEATNDINNSFEMLPYHSYFVGPMTIPTELTTFTNDVHVFGIRFLPCGLYHFIKLPLNEFTNYKCNASDLTDIFNNSFIEKLCNRYNTRDKIKIIEEILIKHLSGYNQEIDKKILFAIKK